MKFGTYLPRKIFDSVAFVHEKYLEMYSLSWLAGDAQGNFSISLMDITESFAILSKFLVVV